MLQVLPIIFYLRIRKNRKNHLNRPFPSSSSKTPQGSIFYFNGSKKEQTFAILDLSFSLFVLKQSLSVFLNLFIFFQQSCASFLELLYLFGVGLTSLPLNKNLFSSILGRNIALFFTLHGRLILFYFWISMSNVFVRFFYFDYFFELQENCPQRSLNFLMILVDGLSLNSPQSQSGTQNIVQIIYLQLVISQSKNPTSSKFQSQKIIDEKSFSKDSYLSITLKTSINRNIIYLVFDKSSDLLKIYSMSEANAQEDLSTIFKALDKTSSGHISREDLQSSPYFLSVFENNGNVLMAFNKLNNQMNEKDFILLANAYRLKLHDFAIMKFEAASIVSKYLSVSAPGQAGPSVKQSFIKLTAHGQENQKLHSIGFQLGIDKPTQEKKIEQLKEILGHPPHQVFLLLKIKTNKNGQEIASKFEKVLNEILGIAKELAPQLQAFAGMLRVYAKQGNGYTNLIIEIDNPFVDGIISFLNEIVQSISPECRLKFKLKVSSNVKNLLKETFAYSKSCGQILAEFDIDYVTLRKIKEIMGDNVYLEEGSSTPPGQLFALLFEQLKLTAEFNNLGEAVSSFIPLQDLPTPHSQLEGIKQLSIKETISQFSEQFGTFFDTLKNSCEAEGELSLNFHDFFFRIDFNVDIEDAFDLL